MTGAEAIQAPVNKLLDCSLLLSRTLLKPNVDSRVTRANSLWRQTNKQQVPCLPVPVSPPPLRLCSVSLFIYIAADNEFENGILIRISMKNPPEMTNQWVLIAVYWSGLALIYYQGCQPTN